MDHRDALRLLLSEHDSYAPPPPPTTPTAVLFHCGDR